MQSKWTKKKSQQNLLSVSPKHIFGANLNIKKIQLKYYRLICISICRLLMNSRDISDLSQY
jgi:hypothetical protein